MTSRPFDFLNNAIEQEVLIVLKDNVNIRGTLKAFDVHMNLALENAEELEDGSMKKKYGKLMIRGDNVLFISL